MFGFPTKKGETIKTPGLLQTLVIPNQHWEEVSMDFIIGIPKSKGVIDIRVIVDVIIKYTYFLSIYHPFKANIIVSTFMESV